MRGAAYIDNGGGPSILHIVPHSAAIDIDIGIV